MPVQNSPSSKNTSSQRHQAVLTPTARAPLDCKPLVHQLSERLDKGPSMEGEAPSRRRGVKSIRSRSFSGLMGGYQIISQGPRSAPKASEAPNLTPSNQPLVSQAEPNFLNMMEQMTQFMGQLTQAVAPRDNSKAPAFKTP
ncbi:hypothetical protein O181_035429 [Austropuccinia psidii MF-1]|uniref:Uncharacterized protein n=1 Tax=Austropuccinia psidii MF-1 TaxID=1389203 RepID=A0A9Q3HAI7_9BASI|nr:hypothetical protein [Austropuccinia psidii MF-1]